MTPQTACCCHLQARANDTLTELECFMVDCREMALELANYDIVELIDAANGQLWHFETAAQRDTRMRTSLVDKLRREKLYFESDDEQFMEEPERAPTQEEEEQQQEEERQARKRSASRASRHSES